MVIRKAISILGATASGKSALAMALARADDRFVIVNADSRQVYEGMIIGTGAPSQEEKARVSHRLYNYRSPTLGYDVGYYLSDVEAICANFDRETIPIFVGGAGFYHRALWQGLPRLPEDEAMRAALEKEWQERGVRVLYEELCKKDRTASEKIHPHNKVRLLRALEVIRLSGGAFSGYKDRHQPISSLREALWLKLGIAVERRVLYERIDRRVDAMLETGLVDELKCLFGKFGAAGAVTRTVGCKELLPYLASESDLDACVKAIKLHTRHYAKRQLTWFRHEPDIVWGDEEELSKLGRGLLDQCGLTPATQASGGLRANGP